MGSNEDAERTLPFSGEVASDRLGGHLKLGFAYWNSLSRSGRLPAWRDVNLLSLPLEAISRVALVDVVRGPFLEFVYRFWGTGQMDAKKIDLTGRKLSDHPRGLAGLLMREYALVVAERRPLSFRRLVPLAGSPTMVQEISLRLPLSDDGETVDRVLSICDWQEIDPPEQWRERRAS